MTPQRRKNTTMPPLAPLEIGGTPTPARIPSSNRGVVVMAVRDRPSGTGTIRSEAWGADFVETFSSVAKVGALAVQFSFSSGNGEVRYRTTPACAAPRHFRGDRLRRVQTELGKFLEAVARDLGAFVMRTAFEDGTEIMSAVPPIDEPSRGIH